MSRTGVHPVTAPKHHGISSLAGEVRRLRQAGGGLQPASCLCDGLTHTTQTDLVVLDQGMIWTGVTQFKQH